MIGHRAVTPPCGDETGVGAAAIVRRGSRPPAACWGAPLGPDEVLTKRELVRTPCSLSRAQLWHSRPALAGRRDELPKIATFLPVVPRGGTNARAARYALGGALPSWGSRSLPPPVDRRPLREDVSRSAEKSPFTLSSLTCQHCCQNVNQKPTWSDSHMYNMSCAQGTVQSSTLLSLCSYAARKRERTKSRPRLMGASSIDTKPKTRRFGFASPATSTTTCPGCTGPAGVRPPRGERGLPGGGGSPGGGGGAAWPLTSLEPTWKPCSPKPSSTERGSEPRLPGVQDTSCIVSKGSARLRRGASTSL